MDVTRLQFRIPADLLEKLKEIAEQENRSVNGQVVTALQQWIAEYERKHPKEEKKPQE